MSVEAAILRGTRLPERRADEAALTASVALVSERFDLEAKVAREPETLTIVQELYSRAVSAYGRLPALEGKRILDIACGSSTSQAPTGVTRMKPADISRALGRREPYSSLFEPWLCRILASLGALPVGVDQGELGGESFEHYRVDLGRLGALDFLPAASFDAVHDSRLFGSPEFTARFGRRAEVLGIAREIASQESRLLRPGGIVLHSDARELAGL